MKRYWILGFLACSACLNLINYVGKGYEAYQKGDLEGAEQLFRTAVKKKPRDPVAHNNLGNVLMDLDRVEEAVRFFKLATVLDKTRTYSAPHTNLARAYYELGKLDLAFEAGEKAKSMNPQDPIVMLVLANIYCAKNERLEDARAFARAATAKIALEDQASAWSTLAEAEYKLNNVAAAMTAIDTAISLDTDNAFYRQQKALYRP
ncbi:tetratricopeptide repeat protein [bacterium]|nr:tetratricopeptide repeat protein [bacterium]